MIVRMFSTPAETEKTLDLSMNQYAVVKTAIAPAWLTGESILWNHTRVD